LVLFYSIGLSAQSNLGIKNFTSDTFRVVIDSQLVSTNFDDEFKIFEINNGPHTLETQMTNGQSLKKAIYLKTGVEHWFELKVDSSRSKIAFYNTFPVEQTDTVKSNRTIIYWNNHSQLSNDPLTNTVQSDSSQATQIADSTWSETDSVTLDSISKLQVENIYHGKKGCDNPTPGFTTKYDFLSQEEFNSKRMGRVRSEFTGTCLRVEELDKILSLFEFEDHKLEIIQTLYHSIYDIDNLITLESQFQLSRQKAKFHSLFELR
jgi:hypothetical protein